jgi:hypothetical protein
MRIKFFFLVITLFAAGYTSSATPHTDSIPANPNDVKSVDAIIHALYDVISGDSGVQRNWDRMRTLFIPEGRLISCGQKQNGQFGYRVMSVEDYIRINGPFLEKSGFFENELSRKTEQFGSMTHVFSTYQTKHKLADDKAFARGINSIQLMFDGKRWWIVNIYWTGETPANRIPSKYLE